MMRAIPVLLSALLCATASVAHADAFCDRYRKVHAEAVTGFHKFRGPLEKDSDKYTSLEQFGGTQTCYISTVGRSQFICTWNFGGRMEEARRAAYDFAMGVRRCVAPNSGEPYWQQAPEPVNSSSRTGVTTQTIWRDRIVSRPGEAFADIYVSHRFPYQITSRRTRPDEYTIFLAIRY